jgi:hypothetical protein
VIGDATIPQIRSQSLRDCLQCSQLSFSGRSTNEDRLITFFPNWDAQRRRLDVQNSLKSGSKSGDKVALSPQTYRIRNLQNIALTLYSRA